MPQFDQVSFMPQIFWVGTLFLVVYVFMKGTFLPRLAMSVKARSKMLRVFRNSQISQASQTIYFLHASYTQKMVSLFESHFLMVYGLLNRFLQFWHSNSLLGIKIKKNG
jgi:hypothetical protein